LRTLDFEKPFPTDPWKINNLTQTVDQEVGGSNPPSCTKHLAPPVRNLSEILSEMPVSRCVLLYLAMCDTLFRHPS
jgi:hypothetical protein